MTPTLAAPEPTAPFAKSAEPPVPDAPRPLGSPSGRRSVQARLFLERPRAALPRRGWVEDEEEDAEPEGPIPPVHLAVVDPRGAAGRHRFASEQSLVGAPVHVWLVAGEGPPERTVRALELRVAFSPNERRVATE